MPHDTVSIHADGVQCRSQYKTKEEVLASCLLQIDKTHDNIPSGDLSINTPWCMAGIPGKEAYTPGICDLVR